MEVFSSTVNGELVSVSHTSPHVAVVGGGEVLYIPPLWLHAATPVGGDISIAINVFFRNLAHGYAAGRDVYGNRDVQAYEQGRINVEKMVRAFDGLPSEMRRFYLLRLSEELRQSAHRQH